MASPRIVPTGVLGGIAGKDGSNVLPTDTAIKQAIENPASQTAVALSASTAQAIAGDEDYTGTSRDAVSDIVDLTTGVAAPYRLLGAEQNAATYADRQVKLAPFHDALLTRDTAGADVVVIADSIGELQAAASFSSRYMTVFRDSLRRFYPTAGATGGDNYIPVPQDSNSAANRWTLVTGSYDSTSPDYGLARKSAALAPGSSISINLTGTSFRVAWNIKNAGGSFTVKVGSAAAVTVSDAVSASLFSSIEGTTSQSFALTGTQQVTIAVPAGNPGGSTFIDGVFVYNGDESKGLRVYDSAHYGFTTQYFANDAGGGKFFDRFVQIKPQLVVVCLGTNERHQNQAPATYATYTQQLLSKLRTAIGSPTCFALVKLYATDNGATLTYPVSAYADQDRQIAAASTDVIALDLSGIIPPADTLGAALVPDLIHPGDAIHGVIGSTLAGFVARRHPLPAITSPVTFTDDFNRADSATTLGTSWAALSGTWGISGNAAYLATKVNSGSPWQAAVRQCNSPNGTVAVDLVTNVDLGGLGLVFRATDANNYFGVRLGSGVVQLYKVVAGAVTPLGDFTNTHSSAASTISVVLNGTSIAVKVNGTTATTATDSFNATATRHGLWALDTTVTRADNFTYTAP